MSNYTAVLDGGSVLPGRQALSLTGNGISIESPGIDWGEAAIKAFMAEHTYGESPVSFRVPNRVITIPLGLGMDNSGVKEEEARQNLQSKVALLQRQGGVIERVRSAGGSEGAGNPLWADVMNASLLIPDTYGEFGVEPHVTLKLECLPDFYEEEIALDAVEGSGQVAAVLNQAAVPAVIKGDYPARCRLTVVEKSKQSQKGLLWGFSSTFYSAAATANLLYDAEELTPLNGAKSAVHAGAYAGKWVELPEPEPETWHPFLNTDLLAGSPKQLSHLGSYRVWARVQGTAGQRLRLAWSVNDATQPYYNESVTLTVTGALCMVDLGEIRIDQSPVGHGVEENWWRGLLQVNTGSVSSLAAADRLWFQPIDDGAGKLRATGTAASTLLAPLREATAGESSNTLHAGTAWANPAGVAAAEADLATITISPAGGSQGLAGTKFGFGPLPAGAVIQGIELIFPFWRSQKRCKLTLGMLKAGAAAGTTKSEILGGGISEWNPAVEAAAGFLGGPSDLWGTTWTAAQIEAAGFGFYLYVSETSGGTTTYKSGPFKIKVYYSVGASAISEDAVLYSERNAEVRSEGSYREDTTTPAYASVSEQTGDLPRLPPSGLEKRKVELFVKNSRGLLNGAADPGIDNVEVKVHYRPCYIGRV
jgi:hypothetical protein